MWFKKYLQTGRFFIQLAAMALTLFGYMYLVRHLGLPQPVFLALVLAAGMFFCGWCCPFGTAQEWVRAIGKKIGLNLPVPPAVDKYLRWGRYLIPLHQLFQMRFLLSPARGAEARRRSPETSLEKYRD